MCARAHSTTRKRLRGHILHWRAELDIFKTYTDQSTKRCCVINHTTVTKQTQVPGVCDEVPKRVRQTETTEKEDYERTPMARETTHKELCNQQLAARHACEDRQQFRQRTTRPVNLQLRTMAVDEGTYQKQPNPERHVDA